MRKWSPVNWKTEIKTWVTWNKLKQIIHNKNPLSNPKCGTVQNMFVRNFERLGQKRKQNFFSPRCFDLSLIHFQYPETYSHIFVAFRVIKYCRSNKVILNSVPFLFVHTSLWKILGLFLYLNVNKTLHSPNTIGLNSFDEILCNFL